jgi:CheY-like chemotaxis protein
MAQQIENLKILIVEDDEISFFLLSYLLTKISREILHAKNGAEAVEICRNNGDLDLIMMDIQMPLMDGYEATEKIRLFNKNSIIIAQTGHSFKGYYDKAKAAGCNECISKPIALNKLKEVILKYFIK